MNGRVEKPGLYAPLLLLAMALFLAACQSPFDSDPGPAANALAAGNLDGECDVSDAGGLVQGVVDRFDGDPEQVMAWLCSGETIDDIMLALQTSRLTGRPAAEILAASKEIGWQALWKGYDVAPDAVAGAAEPVAEPPPASPGPASSAVPAEEGAEAIRLVTRSGEDAGGAAITWEGDRFLLVGRIAALEPENRALQVRVPTEGRREAVYLVRLPAETGASDLQPGWWVRIRGERGEGAYLLAHEIEVLYAERAGVTPTPESVAAGSPAPIGEAAGQDAGGDGGDDWAEDGDDAAGAGDDDEDDDRDGPGEDDRDDEDQDPPDGDDQDGSGNGGDQDPPDGDDDEDGAGNGDGDPPDGDGGGDQDGSGSDGGQDQDPPGGDGNGNQGDEDKGKGKDKGKGEDKGKGKGKDKGKGP